MNLSFRSLYASCHCLLTSALRALFREERPEYRCVWIANVDIFLCCCWSTDCCIQATCIVFLMNISNREILLIHSASQCKKQDENKLSKVAYCYALEYTADGTIRLALVWYVHFLTANHSRMCTHTHTAKHIDPMTIKAITWFANPESFCSQPIQYHSSFVIAKWELPAASRMRELRRGFLGII